MNSEVNKSKAKYGRAKTTAGKGTILRKYNILAARNSHKKLEINSYEVSCYLLLHRREKPHATLFSAFNSLHLNPNKEITNWQKLLQNQIFEQPAWCTWADYRETELNPKISIRVGIHWGKGIPSVQLLQASVKIIHFLKVTKSNILPPPPSNKGKQKHSPSMVAITAYIRQKTMTPLMKNELS